MEAYKGTSLIKNTHPPRIIIGLFLMSEVPLWRAKQAAG